MGSNHNRLRRKWQDYSGRKAAIAEDSFYGCFNAVFPDTDYRIRKKPKEFRDIYCNVILPEEERGQIFNPEVEISRHGVSPDYAIDNLATKKTIYVEVKRQDGWVEGGVRADGRGNAHERSCKYFSPGLLKTLRQKSGIAAPALPFWTVFQGDITRDPCRVREITFWYDTFRPHYFFWRQAPNPGLLFRHFDKYIADLLNA
jgi:hypothetical protein